MRGLEKRIYPIPDLAKNEVFPEEKCLTWYKDGKTLPLQIIHKYEPYLYYQSSYDNASVRSSARKAWQRTRELDFVMGQFRWGSFDYLGETNDWPSRFANFGVIDICGFPKDHFFLYQSMWTDEPMVHILPHWTHPGKEGIKIPVVVYTNCDEVEFFLNGKSLGTQKYEDEQLVWMVSYTPGTIKAVAKRNGKIVAEKRQTTAGKAAGIKLSADRTKIHANRTDVVFISAEITDENGIFCPMADNNIEFEIDGPARIIGIDNGDPIDLSKYKTNERRAFRGKVMLMIQSTDKTGILKIKAHSGTKKSETISIDVI
jgi:beta-galactosidase